MHTMCTWTDFWNHSVYIYSCW